MTVHYLTVYGAPSSGYVITDYRDGNGDPRYSVCVRRYYGARTPIPICMRFNCLEDQPLVDEAVPSAWMAL